MYRLPVVLREPCSAPCLLHVADCIHVVPEVWDAFCHCGISKSPTHTHARMHADFVDLMCREEDIKNIGKSHYRHNDLREEIAALSI